MAASVPTFQLSEGEGPPELETEKRENKTKSFPRPSPSPVNLLSVPTPVRSNIGVNNPAQGQFPLPGSQQIAGSATGNPRNKVALAKGFSLMDWIRLSKSGKDLTGVGGPMVNGKIREVTRQELRRHRKRQDCWLAINGAVFNVTSYMDFHPGGWDEMMKGAGRDATDKFNEVHKWVNYQGLLEACLVGKLVEGPSSEPEQVPEKQMPTLAPPSVLPPIPSKPASPTMDYFQTEQKLTLNIYTKRKGLKRHSVIIDNEESGFKVTVFLPQQEVFIVHMKLANPVNSKFKMRVGEMSGKIEIDLEKSIKQRWQSIGNPLEKHLWFGQRKDHVDTWRQWSVSETCHVTHNTKYLVLSPPDTCHLDLAPGHHVMFKTLIEDTEIIRPYTPVTPLDQDKSKSDRNIHFLIKIYPDGAMTPGLGKLGVGDVVSVSDHTGTFSMSQIPVSEEKSDIVCLLAAGTGITPILSILYAMMGSNKKTRTILITFDRKPRDIIWKDRVSEFQTEHKSWLSVHHVVSDAGDEPWSGDTGRIREQILRKYFGDKKLVWVGICGPPGFNREAVNIVKNKFSMEESNLHVFQG